ncbi:MULTISPECIES: DNA repair protein RecO [unclassified Thermoactinomyces]|jgi:DNA repair protein RecO (recombination protein O)|uniref:DNA repair protein RecO n=1 Tax=unclassified Thermoactinomyces TaxID=2634588 RepID=UPI0018DD1DF4|nr:MULTISPECIES: DNA repair protein RecO [unclassified Thermoactinomyces]MBH8597396.1 DNA repair protein RecO [Thermoactinomyces sp. CICC 10523]MBH8602957.1 DNA repair protein RecO [Thermoactinomyces sp. CICC 10522]MBH8607195.1 DNA repair protein RecO [Thermoactinomyces sp. CICC 10521]
MLVKVEGIVLKAKDYGESHQILTLFTKEQGKLAAMARGSKKTKSRFSAVTEPFTEAQFVLFTGGSGVATLSQADSLDSHHPIRSDLLLTAYGAYWLDLLDKCTEEREPLPPLHRLLSALLKRLEKGTNPEILTRIFELRILKLAGYTPVLNHCVICRRERSPVRFSVRQGGFLCEECQERDPEAIPVSAATGKILPVLERIPVERLGEVKVRPETEAQLQQIVRSFMQEYLPFQSKSLNLLEQIRATWIK